MTDQLFTPRRYPSTLEAERDQLRARVAGLEAYRARVAQVGLLCEGNEAHRNMPHLWPLVVEAVGAVKASAALNKEGGE